MHLPPNPHYTITARLDCPHAPGWMTKIDSAVSAVGCTIGAIDLVRIENGHSLRDYTIECGSTEHADAVVKALNLIEGLKVVSASDNTFRMHLGGKLEIRPRIRLQTRAELSMAYTPGVARVCQAIAANPDDSFKLTSRKNTVAVISDGSAVLGLGNIGPEAAMPVMEGKAMLFKEFGGVDAFPLCVASQDTDEIVRFCEMVAPTFGGINLEDISAPRCVEIERRLTASLDIPVFHDDQHGTAIVVLAALINALKVVGKEAKNIRAVIAGAGAAGSACARSLMAYGVTDTVVCDRAGAIHAGREYPGNPVKTEIAERSNPQGLTGTLAEVLKGADVFIGVSAPNLIGRDEVLTMAKKPIVFALSNPDPEVAPDKIQDIAAVIGTGRSDKPNQINNVLAFPGIFRGALDARVREINTPMKQAAARAIAAIVQDHEIAEDYIVPSIFDRRVTDAVAEATMAAAEASGVARRRATERSEPQ